MSSDIHRFLAKKGKSMNYKICLFVVCSAWSAQIFTAAKTTSVKPATSVGAVKTSPANSAIDAQKVLSDMKKRLDGNRKMLGSLKAEWQQKREDLQKKLAASKAKNNVASKSGANVIKAASSTKVSTGASAAKKSVAPAVKKA